MSHFAHDVKRQLENATRGFDELFNNELEDARKTFDEHTSPFHLLGAGVVAFLEAALGLEAIMVAEASQALAESEASAKNEVRAAKIVPSTTRFPAGTEWELLHSDAVILHGISHALSESYMGYLQCLYALNSAHSKFTKLYKTVYPHGLDHFATPSSSVTSSRAPSIHSQASSSRVSTPKSTRSGFFSRFGSSLGIPTADSTPVISTPEGSLEELIMSGTAFGYGMFNLVFSLLPAAIRNVVGFFGFKHDRKVALRALAVSAAHNDVHSVFAGLTLMTYYGVVLLLSGYQADERHILKQYRAIVDRLDERYPMGSLWILNRAKILRMSYDTLGAIKVLRDGLKPERSHTFIQADALLVFELAWTLLSQREYEEAAETFLKMTEINSWSHATYYFIAAGCFISLKNYERAQKLFDAIPDVLDKKKIGGKDLPTEVFIKKKLQFYKDKQTRLTGSENYYARCIRISPAEGTSGYFDRAALFSHRLFPQPRLFGDLELGIFWNTHSRIREDVARQHIEELMGYSPPLTITSPLLPPSPSGPDGSEKSSISTPGSVDLDTPDEQAIRALLLGIVHRTAAEYDSSRQFLNEAHRSHHAVRTSTWVAGVACFELAVLELKEAEGILGPGSSGASSLNGQGTGIVINGIEGVMDDAKKDKWFKVFEKAHNHLDAALALAPQSVDLSSRLDTRVAMLKDEIASKREMVETA